MLLIVLAAAVLPSRLPPVERCAGDPAFAQFRSQLEASVARRDIKALTGLMAEDVRLTFGGRWGKAGFHEYWTQTPERRQVLWSELDDALRLGCASATDGRGVEYRAFPPMFVTSEDLDGYSTLVSRPGATLRAKPSSRGRLLQRLPPWTVLQTQSYEDGEWRAVRTPRGQRGFVHRKMARSLIDYRLIAGRRSGEWRITAFIAGD